MTDREKVLKGLECCAAGCSGNCPYTDTGNCIEVLCGNALELLKAPEPISPMEEEFYDVTIWHCGACGEDLLHDYNYCPTCGRKVKWDD